MLSLSQLCKKSKRIFKINNYNKLLFIEAFLLCGVMRIVILLIPFKKIKQYIGVYNKQSELDINNSQYIVAKRIAWAVNKASNLTPWESKCLVQALAAQRMLKKRYIYSTLYLGVARSREDNIIAHAWLRCGEMIITGVHGMDNFKEVAKFSNEK